MRPRSKVTTHLDNDEAGTGRVSAGKVDAVLVMGDVKALDGSLDSADEAGEGREDEGLHDDAGFAALKMLSRRLKSR